MKTVNDIWESVNSRLRKNLSNRGVDASRFNILIATAFIREIRYLSGIPETYMPGMQPAHVALDNSLRNLEYMEPLLVVNDSEDPLDYDGHIDTSEIMMITGLGVLQKKRIRGKNRLVISPVDFLLSGEIFHRLNHPVKGPDQDFPVAYFVGSKKMKVQPSPDQVTISYYKVPDMPFRDFTISPDGLTTYLPEGGQHDGSVLPNGTASRTVQPQLDFRAYESLENRVYEMVAVRSGDQQSVAMAGQRKTTGQ